MEHLFVYGTLQDPAVQQRVIGRIIAGKPDTLEGFFRSRIALGDGIFPIVIPRHGSSVDGLLLEVTPEELGRMDIYETRAYRRIWVTLKSGIETWVYA